MILNSAKYSDYLKMLHYGKTKGMILTEKLFPKYSVYDMLILFQTEEEFLSIQEKYKDVFFLRADNVIDSCCFFVLENKHHILSKTGNEFGIQLNINRYDEIEIYEISRLERMIKR